MFKKTLFFKLVTVLVLSTFVPYLYLALADVNDVAVTVTAQKGQDIVIFEMTFTHTATDSTNNLYSQAIDLSYLELENATIQCQALVGITGRDVNIDIEGANNKVRGNFEKWQTRAEFDDFSADAAADEKTVILDRNFNK